ncbi:methyl-CpG-binding domain-containing protein 2-like isoform X2 [Sorghum bicolor]|nr:methyl-CpG-binding domain-containing protein 2-like isoform X2 [Sorghum bicolor]XP_021308487.1 methyl-CpG-binding domain-containing protein 2-like isoform X2 [Sorghum bicolor]|eukprot:XP_021308486.1 methyl-CpG-binding domain-containing protein 2-like isoform X2 [Sorghum bicolor]
MESSKSPQSSKNSQITVPSDSNGPRFDNDGFASETASNQMVVFNSEAGDKEQDEPGENRLQKSVITRGISPSIGAFTVQCAKCFKWRLIPTKEKYEEIRERIIQEPFVCKRACEWKPGVTCNDPEDISQDGSRLWAIDKPNIAQPPRGWERQIRIRGEGGTKFADVYYTSPTGRKLRSLVEIDRFLQENPEYVAQGVTLAQFSFQIPRPLRQDYVKKKPKLINPSDEASTITSKSFQPEEVNPIAWAVPTAHEGDASEEASLADETLPSEVVLTRKRKAESSSSVEPNHLSDELEPKLADAQNGETSN